LRPLKGTPFFCEMLAEFYMLGDYNCRKYCTIESAYEKNLVEYLKENKIIDEIFLYKILCQLCKAISFLHSKGLMHRGIHPWNIFLDKNNNLRLGGFHHTIKKKKNKRNCGVRRFLYFNKKWFF